MKLFSGTACFSPSVPSAVKDAWADHGGTVAETLKERQLSQWFFCCGIGDPCLAKFIVRPIIVFHVNWILAAVSSNFALPLAEYVLDGYNSINAQDMLAKEVQGSYRTGNLHSASEINAQIDDPANDYSMSTRLADGKYLRKRPHGSSPEHHAGQETRLAKKARQGSSCDLGTPVLKSTPLVRTRTRISVLSASEHASSLPNFASNFVAPSPASSPFSAAPDISKARIHAREQSDSHEYNDPGSIISSASKKEHDRPQAYGRLVNKGRVRNDMGRIVESLNSSPGSPSQLSLSPFGSANDPDTDFAGSTAAAQNIWLSLIQNDDTPRSTSNAADACGIPAIRVSDALDALDKLNANVRSNGDDDVTLFVRDRVHRGRKFDLDTVDRRKTI